MEVKGAMRKLQDPLSDATARGDGAARIRRAALTLFRDRGFRQVLTPPGMVAPYYERVGFARQDDRYRLHLA